jgi:hypothetical protein
MNIIDACLDEKVFAPWFRNQTNWQAWFAFLCALFALPMTREQRRAFRVCTGRRDLPDEPAKQAWLICGRRAGKSFMMALIAVYLACFIDWRPYLAPGERGTIVIIAADRRQSRVVLRYIRAFLTQIPMLHRLIERETQEAFDLSNSVTIEVHTCSFRTVRGYTVIAALCDEIAFWMSDETSANPAASVIAALKPAMATVPPSLLLGASTPYSQSGPLFDAHRRYHGKDGNVLVWQAETRAMNPTVPQAVIDEAYEADPASAASEYGAQWRVDVEQLLTREAVTACLAQGIRERPAQSSVQYVGFVDPAGGSGTDAMTLAIAHKDGDAAILDCLRERKPVFSPDAVVKEFVSTLKSYHVTRVVGDRWAGEFVREPFRRQGIDYVLSDKAKSDLYLDCLPAINSGKVSLLDNDRLVNQLCSLERKTARSGKDSIDHAPGGHDDLANVAAGAVQLALVKRQHERRVVCAPEFLTQDEGAKDFAVSFIA